MVTEKVVYLQDGKLLLFDGKEFRSISSKEAKKYAIGSVIPSKLLHDYLFRAQKESQKDQLDIQVEIEIYENGGLDPNIEYAIDYLTHDLRGNDSIVVEAHAVEFSKLEDYFKDYIKKVKAIDYIVPDFLIYKSLYKRGFANDKVDLFLYLSDDESVVSLYKDGEYIASRQIESLNEIAQKGNMHIEELKDILINKGFIDILYEDDEDVLYDRLIEIFSPIIQKIINIVNSKRNVFGVNGIDRLILDFDGKLIKGFNEFYAFLSHEEVNYSALQLEGIESENIHEYISAAYIYDVAQGRYDGLNFTIFERKPPIYKLEVSKFLAVILVTVFLNGLADSYFEYKIDRLDNEIAKKKVNLSARNKIVNRLKKKLNAVEKKNSELKNIINKKRLKIEVYQDTLKVLNLLSTINLLREKFINDILITLKKTDLSISKIVQYSSDSVEINLIADSNQRENIARFIEELSKKDYRSVTTNEISLKNGVYESSVRISR